MAEKKAGVKRSVDAKRDATNILNFLNINGSVMSLGDVRKSEFESIEDPPASVKGLATWAAQINRILRGEA